MASQGLLLHELDGTEARQVLSRARRRRFDRNQILFHEGDPGDALVMVQQGHVGVRGSTPMGDQVTFGVVGPGEFLGEQIVVGDEPRRTATAFALQPVVAHYLAVTDFDSLVTDHPLLWQVVADSLGAQVRRLSARLLEALHLPADQRVLRRLHELTELFADDDATEGTVVVPLTQEDIADLAGTTRPTANQTLKALEGEGVVELARGRVEVSDRPQLSRRAG